MVLQDDGTTPAPSAIPTTPSSPAPVAAATKVCGKYLCIVRYRPLCLRQGSTRIPPIKLGTYAWLEHTDASSRPQVVSVAVAVARAVAGLAETKRPTLDETSRIETVWLDSIYSPASLYSRTMKPTFAPLSVPHELRGTRRGANAGWQNEGEVAHIRLLRVEI